jgi:hypothetical protein
MGSPMQTSRCIRLGKEVANVEMMLVRAGGWFVVVVGFPTASTAKM